MIIGVTGGIGSGKSTIADFFEKWGAKIINVDKLGWSVLEEKQQEIKKAFGHQIFRDGKIDRKELGKIVFASAEKKKMLDSIVHPPLIKELKSQVSSLSRDSANKSQVSSLIVVDCALIYEWGIESWFDKIILVTSDYKKKLKRLMNSGYIQKEAEDRIRSQLPDSEKTADWIIENNGGRKTLEQNAKRIWDKMPQNHQNTKVHKRNYIITLVNFSALVFSWQVNNLL